MNDNTYIFCFHGVPGSGKTECARSIVPSGRLGSWDKDNIQWDHKQFAAPLNELYKVKTSLEGVNLRDRQLWLIDSVCRDLVPAQSASYEDFAELVFDIAEYPTKPVDDMRSKDRNFLTGVADLVHGVNHNAFAKLTTRTIKLDVSRAEAEFWEMLVAKDEEGNENLDTVFIISDLRTQDELDLLKESFKNVTVIKLDVSPEEQNRRLLERDGKLLSEIELAHKTQNPTFTDDQFDLVVKTDGLSLSDQASMIKNHMLNIIKEEIYA